MDKEVNFYEDIDDASKTKSKIKNMFPEKISNTKRNYNESKKFIKNQSKKKKIIQMKIIVIPNKI